eukprot:gb/GFBE01040547.1/.p1 GENE.gb/GFBE01040547.1/~~gb/GFBE01040547.1/.p1  ORF type:complete len:142 (+),score=15.71 gb/GFBE01040547.1/:1-426(+)
MTFLLGCVRTQRAQDPNTCDKQKLDESASGRHRMQRAKTMPSGNSLQRHAQELYRQRCKTIGTPAELSTAHRESRLGEILQLQSLPAAAAQFQRMELLRSIGRHHRSYGEEPPAHLVTADLPQLHRHLVVCLARVQVTVEA